MRITVVVDPLGGRGGMESVIPVTLQMLARRNEVFTLLAGPSSLDRLWESRLPGLSVGPMQVGHNRFRRTMFPTLTFLKRELERLRPDVVISTAPLLVGMLAWVSHRQRIPIVSWIHDNRPRPRGSWSLEIILLRLASGHLTITQGAAEDFKRVGLHNVYAVYYPLDCNEFTDRSLIPRPTDHTELIYIGKLSRPHKRVDRLMHALRQIEDLQTWHLTIVGDGPDRGWLERSLDEAQLSSRVTWHTWSTRPWDLIREASLFLFTSDHEGLGIVLVEAISHGVPIIAMDCCHGPREVISENESGWVIGSGDDEHFASVLRSFVTGQRLLPSPTEVQESLGDNFAPEIVVKTMEQAISRLMRS